MSKQAALEKLEAMQTAKKPRRTAQERALAPLLKERDKYRAKAEEAQAELDRITSKLVALGKMIRAVSGDEQAPESEG